MRWLDGSKNVWMKLSASWSVHRQIAETDRALRIAVHCREAALCRLGKSVAESYHDWPEKPPKLVEFATTFEALTQRVNALQAEIEAARERWSYASNPNASKPIEEKSASIRSVFASPDRRTSQDKSEDNRCDLGPLSSAFLELVEKHTLVRRRREGVLVELGAHSLKHPHLLLATEERNAAIKACEGVLSVQSRRTELVNSGATLGLPGGSLPLVVSSATIISVIIILFIWLR